MGGPVLNLLALLNGSLWSISIEYIYGIRSYMSYNCQLYSLGVLYEMYIYFILLRTELLIPNYLNIIGIKYGNNL